MKRIKVLVLMAMMLGVSNGVITASTVYPNANKVTNICLIRNYEKIEMKNLPEKIMQAVEKEYPLCYLFEAYIGNENGETVYKIQLIDPAGESFYTIVNERGEFLK